MNLPSTSRARTMPVQGPLIRGARTRRTERLRGDMGGNDRRAQPRMPQEARQQYRLRREEARPARGVGRRFEQREKLFGCIGRRSGIVDRDEVDAATGRRAERHHQPQEVRIGLRMRAPEPGRHPSDADLRRRRTLKDAQAIERGRQLAGDGQEDLRPCELLLVRPAVRHRELGVVTGESLLDSGDPGGDFFEISLLLWRGVEERGHGSQSLRRMRETQDFGGNSATLRPTVCSGA